MTLADNHKLTGSLFVLSDGKSLISAHEFLCCIWEEGLHHFSCHLYAAWRKRFIFVYLYFMNIL